MQNSQEVKRPQTKNIKSGMESSLIRQEQYKLLQSQNLIIMPKMITHRQDPI